jgi:hypothetical protein
MITIKYESTINDFYPEGRESMYVSQHNWRKDDISFYAWPNKKHLEGCDMSVVAIFTVKPKLSIIK